MYHRAQASACIKTIAGMFCHLGGRESCGHMKIGFASWESL
jgi:hypothetical protein